MAGWIRLEAEEKEMPPPVEGGSQIKEGQREKKGNRISQGLMPNLETF
jgi:hypothetical protein